MKTKKRMNKFTSSNVISWKNWLKIDHDDRPALAFFFLSRKNAPNARYLPLLNQMQNVRIVLFEGSRFGKLDYFHLKLFKIFIKKTHYKQKNYNWILITDTQVADMTTKQILDIDDPTYTQRELNDIQLWEKKLKMNGTRGVIVVTNETTRKYFLDSKLSSDIFIIQQGHSSKKITDVQKFKNFSVVYSSPYIDAVGDKHGNHPTWGVDIFIKKIVPKIIENNPNISIHLIGNVGNNAYKFLEKYHQVIMHGYKSIDDNYRLLLKCHVALYPRTFDNKRRVLKIYEYIGAILPIVTFDLEDTKPVKELDVGICVKTVDEFIEAVSSITKNYKIYSYFQKNLKSLTHDYSWTWLAQEYDTLITNDFSNPETK